MEVCTRAALSCPSSSDSEGLKLSSSVLSTSEQFLGLCSYSFEQRHASIVYLRNPFEMRESRPTYTTTHEQPSLEYPSLDRHTLISCIQDCPSLSEGWRLHSALVELGFVQDFLLLNLLIGMYHRYDDLDHACRVFQIMDYRTIVSWNTLIMAYSTYGNMDFALRLFWQMAHWGPEPDQITFVCLLAGCTAPSYLEVGKTAHAQVIELGLSSDIKIANALISMYSKCGTVHDACEVFEAMPSRNVISWTALITAHCNHGHYNECFHLFRLMQQHGVKPNDVTFVSVLGACINERMLGEGIRIHASVVENGYVSAVVVNNALINMYGKCGSVHDAYLLFYGMHNCNVDSWNSMMCVCMQHKQHRRGLALFKIMQQKRVRVDEISFLVALGTCTTPSVIDQGLEIHACIIECGLVNNIAIRNALITMYSNCGAIEMVQILFDSAIDHDLILWTAVISSYAQHGHGKKALEFFDRLQQQGWTPNSVTFMCILSACSHAGLIDEGCVFFDTMVEYYKLIPDVDHFSCIIDLLGKAGRIVEAASMIMKLFARSDSTVWRTFLAACQMHGDLKQADWAAQCLLSVGPTDTAVYSLLSNIYAANAQLVSTKKS